MEYRFGALGSDAADKLGYMGFDVIGYSLNKKENTKIKVFSGEELDTFLSRINILVCTVPYTKKTIIYLIKLFNKLQKGT